MLDGITVRAELPSGMAQPPAGNSISAAHTPHIRFRMTGFIKPPFQETYSWMRPGAHSIRPWYRNSRQLFRPKVGAERNQAESLGFSDPRFLNIVSALGNRFR